MGYQRRALLLLVCIIMFSLENGNCTQTKKYTYKSYVRQYDMNHPPQLPENGSYHKNRHWLPEKSIYCTSLKSLGTGGYGFLWKYYLKIHGEPGFYTNTSECVYPRSIEFPALGDEIPTTPQPKLTAVERFKQALLLHSTNFGEFLNKVNKGEHPEPFKSMDTHALADDMMNEIFHHKPDPLESIEDSAPNGIICEHLKFNENDVNGVVIEKVRPICYPAARPPPPPTTTPRPSTTTPSSDIYDKACYVLCHAGAIYQLLSCCRK